MACGCQKNRTQYEVMSSAGKVLWTGASKPVADNVAKRYPSSQVREKPKPGAATA